MLGVGCHVIGTDEALPALFRDGSVQGCGNGEQLSLCGGPRGKHAQHRGWGWGSFFFSFLLGRRGELIEKGRKGERKEKRLENRDCVSSPRKPQSSRSQSWLPPGSLRSQAPGTPLLPHPPEGLRASLVRGAAWASSEFLNLPAMLSCSQDRTTGQGRGSESAWTSTW